MSHKNQERKAVRETKLQLPPGRQRLEIKIVSGHSELLRSIVLSDWEVNVHG